MPQPDPTDSNRIQPLLKPQEKLLWYGRPKPFAMAKHKGGTWTMAGVPACLGLAAWEFWAVSQGDFFLARRLRWPLELFGGDPHGPLPQHHPYGYLVASFLLLIGLVCLFFVFAQIAEGRRTVYAITDQRVLRIHLNLQSATIRQTWGESGPFELLKAGRNSTVGGYVWLGLDYKNAPRILFRKRPWKDGIVGLNNFMEPLEILKTHKRRPKPAKRP